MELLLWKTGPQKAKHGQTLWCTPVIPELRRLRQHEHEFKASLSLYNAILSQINKQSLRAGIEHVLRMHEASWVQFPTPQK
jgi:hypothetical protein